MKAAVRRITIEAMRVQLMEAAAWAATWPGIEARGWDGACVNFAAQLNLHRAGILAVTEAYEGNMSLAQENKAVEAAKNIANELNYVGVLCVEFFALTPGTPEHASLGDLVVNEMAPRPHNSGHYTVDACDVSQFGLQRSKRTT